MLEGYEYNDHVVPIIETLTRRDLFRYGSAIAVAKAALFAPGIHNLETVSSQVVRIPESPAKVPKFQFKLGTQPELQGVEEARKGMRNRVINPSFEDKEQVSVDGVLETRPAGWNPLEDKVSIPIMTRAIYQVNPKTGLSSVATICNIFEQDGRKYSTSGAWQSQRRIKVDTNQKYTFGVLSRVSDGHVLPRLDMGMFDAEGNKLINGLAIFHLDAPRKWQWCSLSIGPKSLNPWQRKSIEFVDFMFSSEPGSAIRTGFTERASFDQVFFGN